MNLSSLFPINVATAASGSDVSTGTAEDKYATPKALADAGLKVGKVSLWISAAGMTVETTAGATAHTDEEMSTNKEMVTGLDFPTDSTKYAQFALAMPKGWDEGTVTAQFFWKHDAAETNFGTAWGIQAVSRANDDAIDAAWGDGVVTTDTGGTTDDLYITAESAAVTIAGAGESELVVFRVYRKHDDEGDTLAIAATLIGVRLFVTLASLVDS